MVQDLLSFLSAYGLAAIFLVTLAARVGVPVPAAPLLVLAGALGEAARLPPGPVALAAVGANLLGDAVWFVAGRLWGHRVLQVVCRVSLSPDSCVRQSEDLILQWGGISLVAAKFVPGVSVVAAPMAGALAMPWPRFIAYGILAGSTWTLLFLGAGALFAADVERVLALLAGGGMVGGALLALLLAGFVGYRWYRRRAFRRAVDVPRIAVPELRALMDSGRPPFVIDVRAPSSVHVDPRQIPGAVNVEFAAIEAYARQVPRDREVVLYCNCPHEASAAQAALVLARAGVPFARPLAGGLDAWFAEEAAALRVQPG